MIYGLLTLALCIAVGYAYHVKQTADKQERHFRLTLASVEREREDCRTKISELTMGNKVYRPMYFIKNKRVARGLLAEVDCNNTKTFWIESSEKPILFLSETDANRALKDQLLEERIANLEKAQAPTIKPGIELNGLTDALDAISTRQADMLSKTNKKRSKKLCQQKTK